MSNENFSLVISCEHVTQCTQSALGNQYGCSTIAIVLRPAHNYSGLDINPEEAITKETDNEYFYGYIVYYKLYFFSYGKQLAKLATFMAI